MDNCIICHKEIIGWGNNPAPVATTGLACDDCNKSQVIPARLKQAATGPQMTYSQRYAALELTDKLHQFAEQYQIPDGDKWVANIYADMQKTAKKATGLDIDEA